MGSVTAGSKRKNFMNLLVSGYKQEVLEHLLENPGYMFTVNELAEKVSGSYNSVNNFLRELEEFDIVSFQKKGRTYLVQYNQDSRYHEVIKTLLRADNTPLEETAREWAEKFYENSGLKDEIRSIILFGSVARGTAGPNSDVDILILVEGYTGTEDIKEQARKEAKKLHLDFELVPVVESVEEFRNNLVHGKRFETNVKTDGIVLEGEELEFED
ncbi:nucleotidyltransferase domain-containing protein [Candidatus Nanosalina sp. VS9-1]|uniref:nucleotidyltransferase domain-containing protein n=1 Tax=Candidatus Nanosalina sp. VS9-1 TaxID=3388566 RepID=UPI0039E172BC